MVSIIGAQDDAIILKHLNCNGLSVQNAVAAFFDANESNNNNNNHNHNNSNRMQIDSPSPSDSDTPHEEPNMSRSQSVSTSLHNQPMNGPFYAKEKSPDFTWNCDNNECAKNAKCKKYKMAFYECSEVGDDFTLCRECVESNPQIIRYSEYICSVSDH